MANVYLKKGTMKGLVKAVFKKSKEKICNYDTKAYQKINALLLAAREY
ncbi:MAG: hypothetical protein QW578_01695 [Thermoplasmatales archaeon]